MCENLSTWNRIRRSQAMTITVITLATCIDGLVYAMIIPLLPNIALTHGLSDARSGLVVSGYAIGLLAATPLCAWLTDRWGHRRGMLGGLSMMVVATGAFATASGFLGLLAARALQGAACSLTWAAAVSYLASSISSRSKRAAALGTRMSGMAIGTLLGPPLGGAIYQTFGYLAVFGTVAALVILDGLGRLALIDVEGGGIARRPISLVRLLRHPEGLVAAIAILATNGLLSMLEARMPMYMHHAMQATPLQIGITFACAGLAYAIFSPFCDFLAGRLGRIYATLLGLGCAALCLPGMAMASSLWSLDIATFVIAATIGLSLASTLPAIVDLVEHVGSDSYATAYGIYNCGNAVGMGLGPIVGIGLSARMDFSHMVLTSAMAFLFLVVVLFLFLRNYTLAPRLENDATSSRNL